VNNTKTLKSLYSHVSGKQSRVWMSGKKTEYTENTVANV